MHLVTPMIIQGKNDWKAVLESQLNWMKISPNIPKRFDFRKNDSFEENRKWMLMTSSQTQNIGVFWPFSKKQLCVCLEFPRSLHKTDLFFVPKFSLLISFWWSSLNKKNLFWFFCRGFSKTQNMVKKIPKISILATWKLSSGLVCSHIY